MARFRDIKTLQKFADVHASIHNQFNQDRNLNCHDIFKKNRAAALADWLRLVAARRGARPWPWPVPLGVQQHEVPLHAQRFFGAGS